MSYTELSNKKVKGRKEYKCIWCGEAIEKSEVHQSRSYIFEGDFCADRLHSECDKAMRKVDWGCDAEGFGSYEHKRGTVKLR